MSKSLHVGVQVVNKFVQERTSPTCFPVQVFLVKFLALNRTEHSSILRKFVQDLA